MHVSDLDTLFLCVFTYTLCTGTCSYISNLMSSEFTGVAITLRHAAQYSMRARLHRACSMQDTSDTRAQSRIAYVLINRYICVLACVLRPHYTLGRPLSHSTLDRFRSASCSAGPQFYPATARHQDPPHRRKLNQNFASCKTGVRMAGQ